MTKVMMVFPDMELGPNTEGELLILRMRSLIEYMDTGHFILNKVKRQNFLNGMTFILKMIN